MARKNKNDSKKPPIFFSVGKVGKRNDSYFQCCTSLLVSNSYADLTHRQRNLYVCMASKYYGSRKPKHDFKDIPELQGDDLFYFQWKEAREEFKLYTEGSKNEFYSDVVALEEHGLIKCVSSGKAHRTKSIYQYSEAWKQWERPQTNNERIKARMKGLNVSQARLAGIMGFSAPKMCRLLASEISPDMEAKIDSILDSVVEISYQ